MSEGAGLRDAAVAAAMAAREGLGGAPADLAVVFATGDHLGDPALTLDGVHEGLTPGALIGCGASGIVGGRREVEGATAVTVWAASFDGDSEASTFHASAIGDSVIGLPHLGGADGAILLPDPWSFPTETVLSATAAAAPGVPILGGLASARTATGGGILFLDEDVILQGAVGVRFDGIELLPCVSQGATPLGPELTVTEGSGHVIRELAGRPALEKLREVILDLPPDDRELLSRGLLLGLVIDGNKPDYVQGDFLVRGLVGADLDEGSLAVGAAVAAGQVVRLHARDADSADRELHDALGLRRQALGGRPPAGALVFTCNGRGRSMFGVADHDAATIGAELDDVPAAGFFAAGEIGPVGGESFLHTFTATVAVFPG